jgi:hypothetical protein
MQWNVKSDSVTATEQLPVPVITVARTRFRDSLSKLNSRTMTATSDTQHLAKTVNFEQQ